MAIDRENLKSLVKEKLQELNFDFTKNGDLILPASDKDTVRHLHAKSTQLELNKSQAWIHNKLSKYRHWFADGTDIVPSKCRPKLVQVVDTWHNDLWRIARFTWSLPYSQGYGRRMRYLVIDESNSKLIGIFALQSAPIQFPARDRMFTYPTAEKTYYVNQTMDIHTLGAVPPYGRLLGGKLVALAAVSNEVRQNYKRKYSAQVTRMERRMIPPELVALTTTSAFGRSSIYNRLRFQNEHIAVSLGYTEGYGTFHLMELYPLFKEFLQAEGISVVGGYGSGPRRKWQLMRRTLDLLGFSGDLLKNGVHREVFLFSLIHNLEEYMEGTAKIPAYRDLPFSLLAEYWRDDLLIPRSNRVNGWQDWESKLTFAQMVGDETKST